MDKAHEHTDSILHATEHKINRIYGAARREIRKEVASQIEDIYLDDEDATHRERLEYAENHGVEEVLIGTVAILLLANQNAQAVTNRAVQHIYVLNYSYTADVVFGAVSVDIGKRGKPLLDSIQSRYDKRAYEKATDRSQQLTSVRRAIQGAIKHGKSIQDIARQIMSITNQNRNRALTIARTETTRTENRGRFDAMGQAQKMGVTIKKRWMATHDSRTRDSHVWVDGEIRELKDVFSNGLEFPGDPNGPAEEVCNCRCTIVSEIEVENEG
ncbi:phage head morphogenesis protein [Ruminococcaceae bacterium OttesenSCG-928-I18]|nr:phage head morphogenesis protein [Ruminococcaceae bacterium OttesenSCG-928-I18]